jgi:hypothetical protein
MSASTLTTSTISLKQGTTTVSGTVTSTGNVATFTPSVSLTAGVSYTATITTGITDAAGNPIASNYSWSFTTASGADVTAPTVSSVTPASNATAVSITSTIKVTFSEGMKSATISTSTFTLKQGTTAITGTVTYSANVATFTPSASLTAGTVYTASVLSGVTDLGGNPLSTGFSWSFTTASAGLSFATDVVPVLGLCNNCHTHPWTTSTNASTFYTNLVNGGYVKPSSYTTSKIYVKLSGGHASSISSANRNKILTWMSEGSKNN